MKTLSQKQLQLTGALLGTLYGICARFVFGQHMANSNVFAVMSLSFIFGVPVMLGFITVWFGQYRENLSWGPRTFMPWAASLIFLACRLLFAWEGLICIFLLLPLILVLSTLGGVLAWVIKPLFNTDRSKNYCVALLALLPFLAAPIEATRLKDAEVRVVQTQIDIRANRQVVWSQIRSVPLIRKDEQFFDFTHVLGFPRPLEARLEGQGVGAIRYATFERGVLFVETVTEWLEGHRLAFTIRADTTHIPVTTFDEHVKVGGPYFDVLDGVYSIEDSGGGSVRLHLSSRQRLSTNFNFYSHLWTDYLMEDLQNYILKIVKARSESVRISGDQ